VFADHSDAGGFTKKAFKTAMEKLLSAGEIEVLTYGPKSKRRTKLVLAGGGDGENIDADDADGEDE
jgi:hypothetical protein